MSSWAEVLMQNECIAGKACAIGHSTALSKIGSSLVATNPTYSQGKTRTGGLFSLLFIRNL
jgi:hypothetical protein